MERDRSDSIRLTVPATAAAVRIARVGAAGLATRAGFSYKEVEEVRLAVGEAAALLALGENDVDARSGGTLVVTYTVDRVGLSIELRVEDDPIPPTPLNDLAAAVLEASVDEWEATPGDRRIVLRKHRTEDADDEI